MKILKSEVASGALLQDVLEFWRNPNLSQPRGKVELGSLLNLPGPQEFAVRFAVSTTVNLVEGTPAFKSPSR